MKTAIRLFAVTVAAALAVSFAFVVSPPVSAQQSDRVKEIGDRLLCYCGCNQMLLRCNHVGCTASTTMLKKLDQVAARDQSVDLAVQDFVQEYGVVVLPEPPRKGFNRLAILIPAIAFTAGLGIVLLVIVLWRRRAPQMVPAPQASAEMLARVRSQTEIERED
jgi:cytochrome c-type biogenesis protein CcmH/NrfF